MQKTNKNGEQISKQVWNQHDISVKTYSSPGKEKGQ